MSAQAMRASLFANAIAATFVGFVESSLASHGRCFVPRIFAILITERAPAQKRLRRYRSPCLVILPSLSLPPLEFCFGTSPIHAEKSRPDRKAFGSATVATKAVASAGPTPGISSARLVRPVPGIDPPVKLQNLRFELEEQRSQSFDALTRNIGDAFVFGICNRAKQFFHPLAAHRRHNPELRKIGADRFDHRGLLPDEQMPCPVKHETGLLFGRFRWNEPHIRPLNGFADPLGIGRIVLLTLHVRLHISRRHEVYCG